MSDTPRTDAFDRAHGFAYASEAIKFAELLERENAALRSEVARLDALAIVTAMERDAAIDRSEKAETALDAARKI